MSSLASAGTIWFWTEQPASSGYFDRPIRGAKQETRSVPRPQIYSPAVSVTQTFTRAHSVDAVIVASDTPNVYRSIQKNFGTPTRGTRAAITPLPLTRTLTHTVDAVVLVTTGLNHSVDAVVNAVPPATYRSVQKNFGAPTRGSRTAITPLPSTRALTHTVDAVVLATIGLTHTVDAIVNAVPPTVYRSVQKNFGVPVRGTRTNFTPLPFPVALSHTVDAVVSKTLSLSHTVDAVINAVPPTVYKSVQKNFGVPTRGTRLAITPLPIPVARSHTVDAVVLKTFAPSHTVDAFVVKTVGLSHTVDAVVLKTFAPSHTVDAVVYQYPLLPYRGVAQAQRVVARSRSTTPLPFPVALGHTVDAVIWQQPLLPYRGVVQTQRVVGRPSAETPLPLTQQAAHTVDAVIWQQPLLPYRGVVQTTRFVPRPKITQPPSVVVRTLTHTVDAQILLVNARQHTVTAIVTKTLTPSHAVDAVVFKTLTRTHTVDAVVLKVTAKTHTVTAHVLRTSTPSHTVSAIVFKTLTTGHVVDAVVTKNFTLSHQVTAEIGQPYKTQTHQVDAYVYDQRPNWPQGTDSDRWPQGTDTDRWPQSEGVGWN